MFSGNAFGNLRTALYQLKTLTQHGRIAHKPNTIVRKVSHRTTHQNQVAHIYYSPPPTPHQQNIQLPLCLDICLLLSDKHPNNVYLMVALVNGGHCL